MAQTPKPPNRKPKPNSRRHKRTHLPALNPEKLKQMMDDLANAPLDAISKRAIENSIRAAANPNAERIDVVIRSLPKERRKLIDRTAKELRALNADVMARGRERLQSMSQDEWEGLLDNG